MGEITRDPIIRLVSFGAGLVGIDKALQRLQKQAIHFGEFDQIVVHNERSLDTGYFNVFGELIQDFPTGYGLWSWKPYLLEKELATLKEGDVLIYLDAGFEINKVGKNRFFDYLDFLAQEDVLLFSISNQQRYWTKKHEFLSKPDQHFFRNQIIGGVIMLRVSDKSRTLIKRWNELCQFEGGQLLIDQPETEPQIEKFASHRHDQSLLSRAAFEANVQTIPDETYFKPWASGKKYPFWALRNKSSSRSWILPAKYLPRVIFDAWKAINQVVSRASRRVKGSF
jgi:hypothetical protein